MKQFYKLKLKLLTPLFYWSKVSPGAVFTDEFIGDLALYYAFNTMLKVRDVSESFFGKFNPNYEEITQFGFWLSCARPLEIKRTEIYAHKTEFKAEVINHTSKLDDKSAKSPFKGYFKQQGIEPLSTFEVVFFGEKSQIPPCLRIGTHLHTLVEICETTEICDNDLVDINLYSWQKLFNQKIDLSKGEINYRLPIYVIYQTKISDAIRDSVARIQYSETVS